MYHWGLAMLTGMMAAVTVRDQATRRPAPTLRVCFGSQQTMILAAEASALQAHWSKALTHSTSGCTLVDRARFGTALCCRFDTKGAAVPHTSTQTVLKVSSLTHWEIPTAEPA